MVPQTAISIDRNTSEIKNTPDVVSSNQPILRARSPSPGGANPVGAVAFGVNVARARRNAKAATKHITPNAGT